MISSGRSLSGDESTQISKQTRIPEKVGTAWKMLTNENKQRGAIRKCTLTRI